MKAKTQRQLWGPKRSFLDCFREFLTPSLWKQAQKQRSASRASRWKTQPLVLVLLFMTWCCGDSQAERFETAKSFCVSCLPRRRRPGRTVQGFQKALAKVPMGVLRTIAAGVRHTLAEHLGPRCYQDGFIPIGCDGSRVECPRTKELERHLGQAGKDGAAPSIWITALVQVRLGVPWAWRIGKGTASERSHLEQMLVHLPAAALLIADAGYVGYTLALRLVQAHICFLIRLSSNATLYTENAVRLERFREGIVYYWPQAVERSGGAPLRVRLIRIRARKKKHDVWLLTNVLEPKRLPHALAARFYRWRWENEGQFRAFKRTLTKFKLVSRTVRLIHRETEGALLALQLMLAQGALAMPCRTPREEPRVCSPRKVLLEIRREMHDALQRGRPGYYQRLQAAQRERRARTTAKATRLWPRRKPHKPPKPPKMLTMTMQQKDLISRLEGEAA